MADIEYYGADYGLERPSRLGDAVRNFGFANWAGAVTSLGLTAGLAVWAVDMTFRDVSTVPVIAALEGPMREAPANPGGAVAPFQGLALSDITSGGPAAPAPDQIVLAPPPVSLDAPALAERMVSEDEEETVQQAESAPSNVEPARLRDSIQMALSEAVEDQLAVGGSAPSAPLSDSFEAAVSLASLEDTRDDDVVASAGPGVANSVRPQARPAAPRRMASAIPATVPTEAPAQAPGLQVASLDATMPSARDADPSQVTPGTRVVQLGAYDSESVARAEWDRIEARFGDYMIGKSRLVQKATSGGRDFWRLRVVGFDDGAAARRFCSELLAKNAACIPLTIR